MEDDDILLRFGIPATPFSVRPRVQAVVNDSRVQECRDMRAAATPHHREGDEAFRCVVCTLPGGTCEHSDGWARRAPRTLLGLGERSSFREASDFHSDEVDVQLADLMDVVGLCNTTRKAAAIHVNDENKMAGPGKIGGACAANNSHHSIVNTLPHSGGGGEGTAKTAEKERGAEDDYVEISAMWARDDATGRNGRGSNDGEGDGGGGNDNREVDDQYKRDSKGQILFDKMGNPVKKVKAERDTSRDDFNVAIHLLRGNGSHGVMHDMSPWQIVAARGAAGSKGLAHPPALRNYRWRYVVQVAVCVHLISPNTMRSLLHFPREFADSTDSRVVVIFPYS